MEHRRLRGEARAAALAPLRQASLEFFARPAAVLAASVLLQFSAALLLAQGKLLGRCAPFGVAFAAAACFPGRGRENSRLLPGAALLGAVTGYLLSAGAADGARYGAAAILCCAGALLFRGAVRPGARWFPPLTAGTALLLTDLVYLAAEPGARAWLLLACEAAACAAAAWFYGPAAEWLRGAREDKREKPPNSALSRPVPAGTRAAAAAAALSLVLVTADFAPLFSLSWGRMAALFLTLSLAGAAGPAEGCAAGLIAGLAADLALGASPGAAPVYAAAGLAAGVFRRRGAFPAALAFTLVHAALLPWVWPAAPLALLWECFAVTVVWFLTRGRAEAALAAFLAPARPAEALEDAGRNGLRALAAAFSAVGEAVRAGETPDPAPLPGNAYDVAVERVCRNCPQGEQCWRQEYRATRGALDAAAEKLRSRGRVRPEDFPPWFAARCGNLQEFAANVNETAALREARSRYRRRAADDARLLAAQVEATCQVLSELADGAASDARAEAETRALRRALAARGIDLGAEVFRRGGRWLCRIPGAAGLSGALREDAEELCAAVTGRRMRAEPREGGLLLREAEQFRAAVGVGLRQRRGERESGDSTACFRTDEGRLFLIIADGMGSGRDAARESAAFVRMLEGFLRAGVGVPSALEQLGPVLAVKCGGESFTTCDVFCVDLCTGEAESWKCGAAPTYVCSAAGRGVRRISAGSMPVGLPSEAPGADRTSLRLEIGDVVVMASDGLAENGDDAWLTALLQEERFTTPSALASALLDAAAKRGGSRDDVSVLTLKLSAARA